MVIRIVIAAMLLAACGTSFNRVVETACVYDAVIADQGVADGPAEGQPIGVFVQTVSDGQAELTPANVRSHTHRLSRSFGAWFPAVADYAARRDAPRRLEGSFKSPHRMIDPAERVTWSGRGAWLRFSAVGFDKQGRHALVFVQRGSFEGDGGDGQFLMLERIGAQWRIARRQTVYVI